jgi:hypothetical protein
MELRDAMEGPEELDPQLEARKLYSPLYLLIPLDLAVGGCALLSNPMLAE